MQKLVKITPLDRWIANRIGAGSRQLRREQIECYQVLKLRETIRWARDRSFFYRDRLGSMTENDLLNPGDLARFPFTTAEDIQGNPLQLLCVSQSDVKRVVTLQTSGTTGEPKRIHFTDQDQESTIDFFHHGMSTLVGPGDRVLILLPGERPGSVGDLLITGLDRLGAVGIPHGPVRDPAHTLEVMARERVDALVGIPTHVLSLARHGNGNAAPRCVLLSTDHVPDAISRELQRLWGCEVYNHYGMTEMGFGGGVECHAHFGYHLREADLYFEIVDPRTGDPVKHGDIGEVVFTTLTRRGMPLIRYRTGDISRFLPERCPCGTVLKSMERVKGRIGGEIALAGGRMLSMADLDEALFPMEGLLDFSATLRRDGDKDWLHITAYAKGSCGERILGSIRAALQAIPSVRMVHEEGNILLSVEARTDGAVPERGPAKRTIVDGRLDGSSPG